MEGVVKVQAEMLNVITWVWGKKYGPEYIERLAAGVQRNLKTPFRFRVFTPSDEDIHLTKIPGCFARLRMFDPYWQHVNGLHGDIVCIDLDTVITGPLDELFKRSETFTILHGGNAGNPCKFNGSMMMLYGGAHPQVWRDFSIKRAAQVPFYEYPDDQSWLAHMLPDAGGWRVGPESGVYCFQKPGWPKGDDLPKDAKIVAFPGWRDPSKFVHLDWVKKNWAA